MKKVLTVMVIMFSFIQPINSQIGINSTNSPPNSSAMLDISSTSRGLLIPRMATIQKNTIPNKEEGLIVFDTDLKLFSYWKTSAGFNGGFWTDFPQLVNNPSQLWLQNGNDIYSNNFANVGIGLSSPTHAKLEIMGQVGAAVAMFGSDKNGVTISADNPEIGFNYFYNGGTKTMKAGYGVNIGMYPTTGDFYIGNFNGNQSLTDFGDITGYQNVMTIKQNGKVGIGLNADPTEKLEVNGNIKAKGLFMPIKKIPAGIDYTVQPDDYTLVINAAFNCYYDMKIFMPNTTNNQGRILNVTLIYSPVCPHNVLVQIIQPLGFSDVALYNSGTAQRRLASFQCLDDSWILIGLN